LHSGILTSLFRRFEDVFHKDMELVLSTLLNILIISPVKLWQALLNLCISYQHVVPYEKSDPFFKIKNQYA